MDSTFQKVDSPIQAKEWYHATLAQKVLKSLEKNNMTGYYVKTANEATQKILELIPEGTKVGYGGSLSLDQIKVKIALREGNYQLIDRESSALSEREMYQLRRDSLLSDVFLSSTNALTLDGKLVNVDAIGNRVAALAFGPPKVIIVAGINKIVTDIEAAMHRIKNYVTPLHSRRLGRSVPCAQIGECTDCTTPERLCNTVVTIEYQRKKDRLTVIIVGEELGL